MEILQYTRIAIEVVTNKRSDTMVLRLEEDESIDDFVKRVEEEIRLLLEER